MSGLREGCKESYSQQAGYIISLALSVIQLGRTMRSISHQYPGMLCLRALLLGDQERTKGAMAVAHPATQGTTTRSLQSLFQLFLRKPFVGSVCLSCF